MVIVNSYGDDTTQGTVDAIKDAGGKAVAMAGDITDPYRIMEVVDATIKDYGRIDILVNNVGAGPKTVDEPPTHPLAPVEAIWNALYNQNLLPTVLMS